MKKTTTETTRHEVPSPYAIEKRISPSVVVELIFISLLFAMLCYAFLGTFKYRSDLRKEKVYKEHIIQRDILSEYNDEQELCIEAFVFNECYGADDGYCYMVDVYIEEATDNTRIDRWCCYVSDYQCDCDYVGTSYLEYRVN